MSDNDPKFTKEDVSLQCLLEYGVTPHAFKILTEAAEVLVDTGDIDQAMRILFNQVANFSKRAGIDSVDIFKEIIDELSMRVWS